MRVEITILAGGASFFIEIASFQEQRPSDMRGDLSKEALELVLRGILPILFLALFIIDTA